MNFSESVRDLIKYDVFTDEDLHIALPESTRAAIFSGLSRSLRSGAIVKLKRGVYVFGDKLRRNSLSKFSVASKLYFPSYISFESALSFHELIPEGVYVTTSACHQAKKKIFNTAVGTFSYNYIPCKNFFIGVESLKEVSGQSLIANPIKALFDLIYLRRKEYENLRQLEEDLRIDPTDLKAHIATFSFQELEILAQSYRKKNITNFFAILMRELK